MALSIKSPRVDRLARELADLTGETITEAVEHSLEVRLREELRRRRRTGLADIVDRFAAVELVDSRSEDQVLGYDDHGLPT